MLLLNPSTVLKSFWTFAFASSNLHLPSSVRHLHTVFFSRFGQQTSNCINLCPASSFYSIWHSTFINHNRWSYNRWLFMQSWWSLACASSLLQVFITSFNKFSTRAKFTSQFPDQSASFRPILAHIPRKVRFSHHETETNTHSQIYLYFLNLISYYFVFRRVGPCTKKLVSEFVEQTFRQQLHLLRSHFPFIWKSCFKPCTSVYSVQSTLRYVYYIQPATHQQMTSKIPSSTYKL